MTHVRPGALPSGSVPPYRLGFAVKVLGDGGLPSADTRRWQSEPHLLRSIELLHPVVDYLERIDVRVYRLSSQVIPYGTHPDLPAFHYLRQLETAAEAVETLGARCGAAGLRLSTHPGQYTVINALDEAIAAKAIADLEQDATLLDALGQGPEGTVVVHVGGAYGARAEALDRWARAWDRLSPRAQARLGLENDEFTFGLEDVLELHRRTGVRVVLDVHHHRVHPSGAGIPLAAAVAAASATWPPGVRPKVHLSSPRTMLEPPPARPRGAPPPPPVFPALRNHADLVTPWDLAAVVEASPGPIDVMLEAKAKDLALLQLRRTLAETLPAVAAAEERRLPVPRPPRRAGPAP